MRRWLTAVFALFTLASLVFAGRGYLYCQMVESATSSCCCASVADELEREEEIAHVSDPCCEWREAHAIGSIVVTDLEEGEHEIAPQAFVALGASVAAQPLPRVEAHALSAPDTAIVSARGSPPRRGKLRARLGVTLC